MRWQLRLRFGRPRPGNVHGRVRIDEEETEKREIWSGQTLMRRRYREARDPEWKGIDEEEKQKRDIWTGQTLMRRR